MPQTADITRILKTEDPTIVPNPMSPLVTKVATKLTKSSGAEVAAARKVAPATSYVIRRAIWKEAVVTKINKRERYNRVYRLLDTRYSAFKLKTYKN